MAAGLPTAEFTPPPCQNAAALDGQSKLMCVATRDMAQAWPVAARDMPKLRYFK